MTIRRITMKIGDGEEQDVTHLFDKPEHERSAADWLRITVSKVERLELERADLGDDIKDVFKAAKSAGLDTSIIKTVIKRRKLGSGAVAEAEALLKVYEDAIVLQREFDFGQRAEAFGASDVRH